MDLESLLISPLLYCAGFCASQLAFPAQAGDGVKLGLGGYFKGYMSWLDQDTTPDDPTAPLVNEARDVRSLDILRETELHFTGETTLDNGLTVGFHGEADVDGTFDARWTTTCTTKSPTPISRAPGAA